MTQTYLVTQKIVTDEDGLVSITVVKVQEVIPERAEDQEPK